MRKLLKFLNESSCFENMVKLLDRSSLLGKLQILVIILSISTITITLAGFMFPGVYYDGGSYYIGKQEVNQTSSSRFTNIIVDISSNKGDIIIKSTEDSSFLIKAEMDVTARYRRGLMHDAAILNLTKVPENNTLLLSFDYTKDKRSNEFIYEFVIEISPTLHVETNISLLDGEISNQASNVLIDTN